jgi:hypothetical protein
MNAVVFIDSAVISFVTDNFVPVRIMADDPVYSKKFNIKWTPSVLMLDVNGIEHYRTLGFYPPRDLIPSLMLGMGKVFFNQANLPAAIYWLNRIIAEYPDNSLAPETVYLKGVSNYLQTHDVIHLIEIYNRLEEEYPDSPWFTRADPYRLLKK